MLSKHLADQILGLDKSCTKDLPTYIRAPVCHLLLCPNPILASEGCRNFPLPGWSVGAKIWKQGPGKCPFCRRGRTQGLCCPPLPGTLGIWGSSGGQDGLLPSISLGETAEVLGAGAKFPGSTTLPSQEKVPWCRLTGLPLTHTALPLGGGCLTQRAPGSFQVQNL